VRVPRLAWLGLSTRNDEAMVHFLEGVLGLDVEFANAATTELSIPNDDRVQMFGPGHRYCELYKRYASWPIPLFEVDDVDQARIEFEAAGVEVIGQPESDDDWVWIHVSAPDGHLFVFAFRRRGSEGGCIFADQ
jgi:predicted enzyme related to lactoylglutathione lyase